MAADDGDAESTGDVVAGLARGLDVLRHCAVVAGEGTTVADAARATGFTRATARRSLLTLAATGYLRTDGRRFHITAQARLLAGPAATAGAAERAGPVLARASRALGESVSLATLDGAEIVYAARAEARRIIALDLAVGARLPATCTSMGRVLLAFAPEEVRDAVLAAPRVKRTPRTVTDAAALRVLLAAVRADRFCLVDGELELGLRSLAVPVACPDGTVPAAINVSTLAARTRLGDLRGRMLATLKEAAAAVAPFFAADRA